MLALARSAIRRATCQAPTSWHPQLLPSRAVLLDQLCLAWGPGTHQCPRDAGRILLLLELGWEGTHSRFAHLENPSRCRWKSDKWESPLPSEQRCSPWDLHVGCSQHLQQKGQHPQHMHNGLYTVSQQVPAAEQNFLASLHLHHPGGPAVPFLPQITILHSKIHCDSSSRVPVKQMRDSSTKQLALAKRLPAKLGKAGRLPTTPSAPH